MNKKVVIAVFVVLLLLLGGWYFLNQKKSFTGPMEPFTENQQTENSTNLKDLLTRGMAQTCTYSSGEGSGKVYVSGNKMRGDFETQVEGKSMKSHMIVKDNTSYVWTDDQKTGFSMAFDPSTVDTSISKDTSLQSTTTDLTANYDYKCSKWVEDYSQFTPPTDVTFSSFDIPKTQGGSESSQCSYCNALNGDDKTQCLKALNCN